jgi:hypothetical protein
MRFYASAALLAALVLSFSAAARSEDAKSTAGAGFSLNIPASWSERPSVAADVSARVSKPGMPKMADQVFAWGNSENTVIIIVQAVKSEQTMPSGTFRTNLEAFHDGFRRTTTGIATTNWTLSDDGTTMTSRQEGDFEKNALVHVISLNEADVDTGGHLLAFTVSCYLPKPVSDTARSACTSVLSSFKITLGADTFLRLEPKT